MDILVLKLILAPVIIGFASLAGRKWGPAVSGWIVGLPLTSGPVVFFLALSHDTTTCGDPSRDGHIFSGYNPIIPTGATIQGLTVRLDAKVDKVVNDPRLCVFLSWDGGSSWTSAHIVPLTRSESSLLLGGPSDLWGHSWTTSELSNNSFRLKVTTLAGTAYRDFSLDWAALKITYTTGGDPPPSPPPPSSYKTIGYFVQWGIYQRNYLVKNLVTSGSAAMVTLSTMPSPM